MWKIIAVGIWDAQNTAPELIADSIASHTNGETMVNALNGANSPDRSRIYKLVERLSYDLDYINPT